MSSYALGFWTWSLAAVAQAVIGPNQRVEILLMVVIASLWLVVDKLDKLVRSR